MIKAWNRQEIIELWNEGESAGQIVQRLHLPITVRQVQRIGAEYGSRRLRASGRLASDDYINPLKDIIIQLMVQRGDDPHLCALCGDRSEKRMTIHHTRYEGATLADLVFACMRCQLQWENRGLA
jgi:hypothetical protein